MHKGKIFIISAPSGTGKTTLVSELIVRLQRSHALERVITYTTKRPRSTEIHGKDYYFISEAEFKRKIEEGFFIEWSCAYGAYYGSPRSVIEELAQGKSCIAVLDRAGARAIKAVTASCILIWLKPPTFEDLQKRLTIRAQDTQAEIERRLQLAKQELSEEEHASLFDYTIINGDLTVALGLLENIIKRELIPSAHSRALKA